jgi:YqjK-like protein
LNDERTLLVQQRQLALLARSDELRASMALQVASLQPALHWAIRAREGWRWLRAHPEWPLGAALVLVVARPRRSLRWGLRLWSGWRLWQRLRRAWAPLR